MNTLLLVFILLTIGIDGFHTSDAAESMPRFHKLASEAVHNFLLILLYWESEVVVGLPQLLLRTSHPFIEFLICEQILNRFFRRLFFDLAFIKHLVLQERGPLRCEEGEVLRRTDL